MATFASVAGVKLPEKDREGQPIIFDSYDMSPVLFGTGKCRAQDWFYFTENELSPGAARVGNYKSVFNLRGDDGQPTGGLAVDTNLGWKGAEKYVATVPQIFDLWQDPQERYDLFMNNFTERTWTLVPISDAIKELMKTYVEYPPRKLAEHGLRRPDRPSRSTRSSSGCASSSERKASTSPCRPATNDGFDRDMRAGRLPVRAARDIAGALYTRPIGRADQRRHGTE